MYGIIVSFILFLAGWKAYDINFMTCSIFMALSAFAFFATIVSNFKEEMNDKI